MVVRRDEAIRGTATPQKGRRPRRMNRDRLCAADDCTTKLSVYNRSDFCWIHEEPHPFVLDGVRKRRDEPVEPSTGPPAARVASVRAQRRFRRSASG